MDGLDGGREEKIRCSRLPRLIAGLSSLGSLDTNRRLSLDLCACLSTIPGVVLIKAWMRACSSLGAQSFHIVFSAFRVLPLDLHWTSRIQATSMACPVSFVGRGPVLRLVASRSDAAYILLLDLNRRALDAHLEQGQ